MNFYATGPVSAKTLTGFAREAVEHTNAPAAGIAISNATGVSCVWAGKRMVGGSRPQPSDVLRIASVTKAVTAVVAWRLVEMGVLDLTSPISRYLPARWQDLLGDRRWDGIRVEHLLRHTSGMSDYAEDTDYKECVLSDPGRRWKPEDQVSYALDGAADVAEPGQVYHYSDTGYVLLAEVLSMVGEAPLDVLGRRLAGYGDMESFRWEAFEPSPSTAVRVHQYISGIDVTEIDPTVDSYGGGGLLTSLPDLAVWFQRLRDGHVLSELSMSKWLGYQGPGGGEGHFGGLSEFDVGDERRLIGHRGYWGVIAGYLAGSDVTLAAAVTDTDGSDYLLMTMLPATIAEIAGSKT